MIRKIYFRLWLLWELTVKTRWWYGFEIEKNEFYESLNINLEAVIKMSKEERKLYFKKLAIERSYAHDRIRITDITNKYNDITDSHC